jgi:hypothetical protein
MRLAIVIGRKHGDKAFSTVVEATDPRSANDAFKRLLRAPGDLAEIQFCELDATKRKHFGAPPAPAESRSSARVIVVPSLEEVRASGYTAPGVAEMMVARIQAMADALAADPNISDDDLNRIQSPQDPAQNSLPPENSAGLPAAPEPPAEAGIDASAGGIADADGPTIEAPSAVPQPKPKSK